MVHGLLVLSSWFSTLARHLKDGQQPAVRGQAVACVACRRRQKKYERPQSTPVPAAQPHDSGPSPTATWAMTAETRLMAKPAYAHSLSLAGTGASSSTTPRSLAHESSTRKYAGKPRWVNASCHLWKSQLRVGREAHLQAEERGGDPEADD